MVLSFLLICFFLYMKGYSVCSLCNNDSRRAVVFTGELVYMTDIMVVVTPEVELCTSCYLKNIRFM